MLSLLAVPQCVTLLFGLITSLCLYKNNMMTILERIINELLTEAEKACQIRLLRG